MEDVPTTTTTSSAAAAKEPTPTTHDDDGDDEQQQQPPRAMGPQEQQDQWRSTKTHETNDLYKIYKELFFAGFPCRRPHRRNTTTDASLAGDDDVVDESVATFPENFVRDFFANYGAVEHLIYDADRGMGSVTFEHGEAAEDCYISAHLSLLPAPQHAARSNDDDDDDDAQHTNNSNNNNNVDDLLLYLEFAQACPFVNPLLLLHGQTQSGEMSRHFLRTFPIVERRFRADSANAVVAVYAATQDGGSDDVRAAHLHSGPQFPGADIEPAVLTQSLWRVLSPLRRKTNNNNNTNVRVLDLWWEFYNLYVVHKTQPDAERIRDPLFRYAQGPSPVQEVRQLQQVADSASSTTSDASAATLKLLRLMREDVYHSICAYLCYKRKLKHDASWASLMRDVHTPNVVAAMLASRSSAYPKDLAAAALSATLHESLGEDAAEEAFFKLSLLQSASNVIDNVIFMRGVRRERYEMHRRGGRRGKVVGATAKEETKPTTTTSSSSPQEQAEEYLRLSSGIRDPHDTSPRDENLFVETVEFIDTYAASGSASALLSVCEGADDFQHLPGHLGYEYVHRQVSIVRELLKALWVPLVFLAVLISALLYFNLRVGMKRRDAPTMMGGEESAVPPHGANFAAELAKKAAEAAGVYAGDDQFQPMK